MSDNPIVLPWDIKIFNLDKNNSNESLGDITQEKTELSGKLMEESKNSFAEMDNDDIVRKDLNYLRLRQIERNIKQLQYHLISFQEVEDARDQVKEIESDIETLKEEKRNLQKEIKDAKDLANIFEANLDIPVLQEDSVELNWHDIHQMMPNRCDGKNKSDFKSLWNSLKALAVTHKFSEENMEAVIKMYLTDEALNFFESKRSKPFRERMKLLLEMYLPSENIRTTLWELKHHSRGNNIPLRQYMTRLEFLLDQTDKMTDPALREGRKIQIMEEKLLENCSEKAKERIEAKQQEMFESGIFLQLNEKLQLACKVEELENYIHQGNNGKENDEYNSICNVEHLNDDELPHEALVNTVYPHRGRHPSNKNDMIKNHIREDIARRRSQSRDRKFDDRRNVHFDLSKNQVFGPDESNSRNLRPRETIIEPRMPFRNSDQSRETTIRRQQDMIKQLTIKLNEIELRNKNYHDKRFERSNGQPQHHRTFHGQEKGRYYSNRGTQNMEYMPFYTVENHYPKDFHIRIKSPTRQGYQSVNKRWYKNYDANRTISSEYRGHNNAPQYGNKYNRGSQNPIHHRSNDSSASWYIDRNDTNKENAQHEDEISRKNMKIEEANTISTN